MGDLNEDKNITYKYFLLCHSQNRKLINLVQKCLIFSVISPIVVIRGWCYISACQTHPHNCSYSFLLTQRKKERAGGNDRR